MAGKVSATAEGEVSATAGARRESGAKEMHVDPVLVLARGMRPLGAKPVAKGRKSDPNDTPLVLHEQEFVFLLIAHKRDQIGNRRMHIITRDNCAALMEVM
jgi:hypothetical protein